MMRWKGFKLYRRRTFSDEPTKSEQSSNSIVIVWHFSWAGASRSLLSESAEDLFDGLVTAALEMSEPVSTSMNGLFQRLLPFARIALVASRQ
jgi:hypothetical protein